MWLSLPTPHGRPRRDKDLLGGVTVLEGPAQAFEPGDWSDQLYQRWKPTGRQPIHVRLIPYYAWANRGTSQMTVWMPVD